ncbi:Uma2 family endonuclease [Sphingomonas mollis]|uniref:Uma2 family endonuclease n=1 Tax=Sphingomonas mollis TaxID=2795726 RepID=A0ABS0XR20_9SPHN|nr:Uma2 family endonuclease [Sphingomonas sp. BT553]MBJ6122483.1 Uma2 family endonuclease [Sphingomonas sp. BT553]
MNRPATTLSATPFDTSFTARFTTAEFLRMMESGAFDDMKMELVQGELERMNPPHNAHAGRQARIVIRLAKVVSEELIRGEVGLDLGDDTVMACDAAILDRPVGDIGLLHADDVALVIEIAESTIVRDLGLKRLAYARAGIAAYWVIDGERSVVHVFGEPVAGDYALVGTIRFGEPIAVPGTDATIVID